MTSAAQWNILTNEFHATCKIGTWQGTEQWADSKIQWREGEKESAEIFLPSQLESTVYHNFSGEGVFRVGYTIVDASDQARFWDKETKILFTCYGIFSAIL
jgi:hypothetical protein